MDGARVLMRSPSQRRARAVLVWILALLAGGGWVGMVADSLAEPPDDPGAFVGMALLGTFAALLLGAASWLTFGRTELRLASQSLQVRRHFGPRSWTQAFDPPHLRIERSTDSDGDEHFTLVVRSGRQRHHLAQSVDQAGPVIYLGRWIAEQTGTHLDLAPDVEDADPGIGAMAS
jgi:hypothetical protein